jgi:hypothetical protein
VELVCAILRRILPADRLGNDGDIRQSQGREMKAVVRGHGLHWYGYRRMSAKDWISDLELDEIRRTSTS